MRRLFLHVHMYIIDLLCFNAGVYLNLNDDIIPNHGYIVIWDIGSTDDTALICRTNRPADLGSNERPNSGGDWFAPDETRVVGTDVPGFRRNRAPMIVRLWRDTADPPSEGIYHCLIEDDTFTIQALYVGLYNSGAGMLSSSVPLRTYNWYALINLNWAHKKRMVVLDMLVSSRLYRRCHYSE